MVFILKLLHGAYAYLLMFQIGIIAVLTLMLLWLIVRRTKMQVLGPGSGHATAVAASSSPTDFSKTAEYQLMQSKINSYEAERTSFVAMKNDYDALQQKVKFLESKLLEYEILQEEIGTLSSLKVENERLKKEVISLQGEVGVHQKTLATQAPPAVESPASPGPVVPPTEEATELPKAPEPSMELETIPIITNSLVDGPNTTPEPPPAVRAGSSPEPSSPDLDSLLKEIDALTGTDQAPKT